MNPWGVAARFFVFGRWIMKGHGLPERFRTPLLLLLLIVGAGQISAVEYISNLGNRWIDPGNPTGNNSIGDIHGPAAPYGPFIGTFYTGVAPGTSNRGNQMAGVDTAIITNPPAFSGFNVDMVTLEFLPPYAATVDELSRLWADVVIHICGDRFDAKLGKPIIDERQTQWPHDRNPSFCTVYVDFLPLTNIVLRPSTMYQVKIDGVEVGVLFSLSSKFTTATDWKMGPTMTRCPWAAGEFLKFAVAATPVIAPLNPPELTAFRSGAELVLSWPSDSSLVLYSADLLDSALWAPVSTEGLVSTGGQNFLRVPLSAESRYFRLQPL